MPVELQNEKGTLTLHDDQLNKVEGGDPDVTYTVKQLTGEISRRIARPHDKGPSPDAAAILDDLIDYCLIDWTGIVFDGEPVPCDRRHKLLLDAPRKQAIVQAAALNQVTRAEVRAASFREP